MEESRSAVIVMNSGIEKHGSFEDYLVSLACTAQARGWRITYILPGIATDEVRTALERCGAKIVLTSKRWTGRSGVREVSRLLRNEHPSLVDFHFCDPVKFLPVFLRCRLRRIPVMFHYHGEIRPIESLRWKNLHLSSLRLASLAWSTILTVSHANARFLRALHIGTPIQVVYNGIDVPRFLEEYSNTEVPLSETAEEPALRCVYIGSLTPRKRVDILLRAFALVLEHAPNARLILIGGGKLESQLRALARELGIENAVDFKSLLKQYPFGILKTGGIFVSASESESFGLVFAEAMSFRLPVVACRVGGIPEVIADGQTGKLVAVNQPREFAAALLSLMTDADLRETMGKAGQQRVISAFQLSRCVAETLDAFAATARATRRS